MSSVINSMETAYDADFFEWTQHQAHLIRRLRRLEPSLPNDIDLDHIAEEIEDLGKSHLHTVESLTENIFVHLLKYVSAPDSPASRHWKTETVVFATDLLRRYSPSMRQRLDLQKLWKLAFRLARVSLDEHGDRLREGLPQACPYSMEDLLADDFDVDELAFRLRNA